MSVHGAVLRGAGFLSLFLVLYAVAVGLLTAVEVGGVTLMDRVLLRHVRPGGYGRTLEKLRDVDEVGPVDVVFAGSSHSYRGFDPRIFAEAGLSSYNLGTNSQTPLNSLFLLREHWDDLRPELVVYEIYPTMLATKGLESFHDLAINLPLTRQRVAMALATRDPRSLNTLLAVAWRRAWRPLDEERQADFPGERLVGRGYVARTDTLGRLRLPPVSVLEPDERQFEFLRRIVEEARGRNARVVFVSQPVVSSLPMVVRGQDRIKDRVRQLAREVEVPYLDLQGLEALDWRRHFFDPNHLNQAGVQIFNRVLLDSLAPRGRVEIR